MPTLTDIIRSLDDTSDDGVIYVEGSYKDWRPDSSAVVVLVGEFEDEPAEVSGCKYFLECSLAKEILDEAGNARKRQGMAELSLQQRVKLAIYYAVHDTLPPINAW